MTPAEARDLGRTAGTTLRQLAALVKGGHFAVSDTVHDAVARGVGPSSRPARVLHDTMAAGVYASVGLALDAGSHVAGRVAAHRLREGDRPSVHDGPAAHHALAVGLGLRGDTIARDAAALAPPMHVRWGGMRLASTPETIRESYARVTPDIVVFLHGLFETERAWDLGTSERDSYPTRLTEDLGFTPVMVRYNTGSRISENALALSALLDEVVRAWPVPVERIVLIGHSMGGLVIHGALAAAAAASEAGDSRVWVELVTETVALGSPHHGSAISRAVADGAHLLGQSPKSQWLADFVGHHRSVGVRDLMHGNVVAADWEGHDADDRLDRRTHPLPSPGIINYAVVGLFAGDQVPPGVAGPIGDLVGSAHSASHDHDDPVRRRFDVDGVAVVTGVGHFGLLNHDEIYGHLRRWLSGPPVARA